MKLNYVFTGLLLLLITLAKPGYSGIHRPGLSTNTANTIVSRDGSGNFSAGTITAALTGNASTATALAANPADCSADTYATTIAANGTLTCAAVTSASMPAYSSTAIAASEIDWALVSKTGGIYTKTLGANTTFTFANAVAGQTIICVITNTASNWTVTWPTTKWPAGSAPTQTVGAKADIITFIYDGTNYYGNSVQNF